MKKFLRLLLIFTAASCAFTPRAFAQFSWRFTVDFNARLLSWNVPTGERAEKFITVGDSSLYNSAANNPMVIGNPIAGVNRGDYTYTTGTLDVLNNFRSVTSLKQNALNLVLDYRNPSVQLHTMVPIYDMVQNVTAAYGTGQNQMGSGHSFIQGSGGTPNWADFLRYSFEEWYVRGNFAFLTGYVGNTGDIGKVQTFNNFTDDALTGIKVDDYGVNTPAQNTTDFRENRINNFQFSAITRTSQTGGEFNQNQNFSSYEVPYIMVAARVEKFLFPLTFQITADPGDNNLAGAAIAANFKNFSGAIRVSGEKAADRITFDAVYRFRGGDPTTLDNYDPDDNPGGSLQPDGRGFSAHTFGVYANILNIPQLGIGFGYSGYLRVFEDSKDIITGETTSRTSPVFSGIDLRLLYTGIAKTTITFNNNISFADTGKPSAGNTLTGVWGQELPADTAQDWFALYNALGINYRVTPQLTASFQIGNRLGVVRTLVSPSDGSGSTLIKMSQIQLGGGGHASLWFNPNLMLQGGFSFLYRNYSYSNSASLPQTAAVQEQAAVRDASGGMFAIAFPIRMVVHFRP